MKKNLMTIGVPVVVFIVVALGYLALKGNGNNKDEAVAQVQETDSVAEESGQQVEAPVDLEQEQSEVQPDSLDKEEPEPQETAEPQKTAEPENMEPDSSKVFTEEEQQLVQEDVEAGVIDVPEEVNVTALDTYLYATRDVNLREKASTGAEKLLTVAASTKVHVVGITEDGQWYQVTEVQGNNGFISAAYLQQTAPTTQQVKQTVETEKAIEKEIADSEAAVEKKVENMTQSELDRIAASVPGGTTDMSTLNDLPTFEYEPGKGTGKLHAQ